MSPVFADNSERMRARALGSGGFTMPELLVAVVLLLVMTAGAFLLLRPRYYTAEMLKAERRVELAAMAQAIKRYQTATGHFPDGLPARATVIGNGEDAYDLCRVLVPDHMPDLPLDPQTGAKFHGDTPQPPSGSVACDAADVVYLSGYTVQKARNGGVTVAAPITGKDALAITVR